MSSTQQEGVAVITGASRGVGRAAALALAVEHGVAVLAVSRDRDGLATLIEEAGMGGGRVEAVPLDITASDAAERLRAAVGDRPVRMLVHNAGALHKTIIGAYNQQGLEALFGVNVFAPLLLTQALREKLKGGGHVVHISSMGGFQDSVKFAGLAGYSASKAALACLAQCLAVELADQGIKCNCLALGAADTEMLREAFPGYTAPVSAEEMGRYVARFALEGHQWFNGKVLPVALSTP